MARYNIVKNIRKRKIIILVVLLILIMVSWLIWGNLSVETNKLTVTSKDLPEAFDNFLLPIFRICIMQNTGRIMKS